MGGGSEEPVEDGGLGDTCEREVVQRDARGGLSDSANASAGAGASASVGVGVGVGVSLLAQDGRLTGMTPRPRRNLGVNLQEPDVWPYTQQLEQHWGMDAAPLHIERAEGLSRVFELGERERVKVV